MRHMTPLQLAIYVFAIPMTLALVSGVNEAGSAKLVSKEAYILRYMTSGMISWLLFIAVTAAMAVILRPWHPPFLFVLLLATVVKLPLNAFSAEIWQPLFEPYLAPGSSFYKMWPWRFDDPDYMKESAFALLNQSVIWVSINLIFWRLLHIPLYGFQPPSPAAQDAVATEEPVAAAATAPEPALYARLPVELDRDIVALEAQEHYTKVHTRGGSALVLYRFSDAVRDLAPFDGLQVHRSYWVRRDAIASVERTGRTYTLTLSTGLTVPVSRSYKIKIDELGLAGGDVPSPG